MKIKTVLAGAALALGMALAASSANAAILNWTLSGVTFDDGGTAFGNFSTDDSTGNLLAFDITTTAGSALGGFHYDATTSLKFGDNTFSPNSFVVVNNAFSSYFNFTFVNPLTSPGVDALVTGFNSSTGSWECDNCGTVRSVTGGVATTGGVPEPAAWAMMLAGFAGIGGVLRMRRRAAVAA